MWQRAFVLEHLVEITAIHPAIAGRAPDEVLGLARRAFAKPLSEVLLGMSVTGVLERQLVGPPSTHA
jgi:hypothetical protein